MRPLAFLPFNDQQLILLHRSLYLLGLMTIACGLAWSNALMSIGQFILAGNWLLEGMFIEKWQKFRQNPIMQLLLSIWLIVLFGFLWTDNFDYALKDARIKFPLFLLPFVIGSSDRLSKKEWKIILAVYLGTLSLLYLSSLGKYFGIIGNEKIVDKRELSIFISHIRYGLNLLLGGALAIYYRKLFGNTFRWPMLLIALFLFSSLLILELYTAFIIGISLLALYIVFLLINCNDQRIKSVGSISIAVIFLMALIFIRGIYTDFNTIPELTYDQYLLKEKSKSGKAYTHNPHDLRMENGVYLWRYVQEDELRTAWNQRSSIDFDGNGEKGNPIFQTLVRYLSSKGLRKDADGMTKLKEEEIKAIEKGIPNRYYLDHLAIQNRIYTTFYELDTYQKFGYAEGYSLGMRLEYWKTAWRIIKRNQWTGVGTGDVPQAFELQYYLDKSSLSEKSQRRAHNQFLTIWLTFGLGGFIFFLIYLFKPLRKHKKGFYPLFFFIVFMSFFTEDTLETQAGVSFFAFFNSLYLLGMYQSNKSE